MELDKSTTRIRILYFFFCHQNTASYIMVLHKHCSELQVWPSRLLRINFPLTAHTGKSSCALIAVLLSKLFLFFNVCFFWLHLHLKAHIYWLFLWVRDIKVAYGLWTSLKAVLESIHQWHAWPWKHAQPLRVVEMIINHLLLYFLVMIMTSVQSLFSYVIHVIMRLICLWTQTSIFNLV